MADGTPMEAEMSRLDKAVSGRARTALVLVAGLIVGDAAFREPALAQAKAPVSDDAGSTPADDGQRAPVEPRWFLDPSYIGLVNTSPRPSSAIGTESQQQGHWIEIQSHNYFSLAPRQNSDQYMRWIHAEAGGKTEVRHTGGLTLSTTIRGHAGQSVPIQTPSIGFAGRYQRLMHARSAGKVGSVAPHGVSSIRMFGFGLVHHSNGQDGCTFADQSRGVDGRCSPDDTVVANTSKLNTIDGSFGTNYWAATFGWSRRRFQADGRNFGFVHSYTAEGRYHQDRPGGGLKDGLADVYGRWEAAGSAQVELPHPRIGFKKPLLRELGRFDRVQLTSRAWVRGGGTRVYSGASVDAAWLGFAGGVAGPFVRWYEGDDYYNIRFAERRSFKFYFGLMFDLARLTRIPAPVQD